MIVFTAELYQSVKSFDEKNYLCETCHGQAVHVRQSAVKSR